MVVIWDGLGWYWVDVTGVCWEGVGSCGVHGLCSDPFCRSWLDLVSIGPGWDLGMKKHRIVCPVLGVGGMVGVLGEEGVCGLRPSYRILLSMLA